MRDWLEESKPDVALLQEIKSVDENFPREPIEDLVEFTHRRRRTRVGVAGLGELIGVRRDLDPIRRILRSRLDLSQRDR